MCNSSQLPFHLVPVGRQFNFIPYPRWLRQIHRIEDIQQELEDDAGHRRMERGLLQVLSHGRLAGEEKGVRQERYQGIIIIVQYMFRLTNCRGSVCT